MADTIDTSTLSPMQMRFVSEYISDPSSQAAAARRAGYSSGTAAQAAHNLLRDPRIKKLVEDANNTAIKKLGLTKERILQELALVAFADTKEMIKQDEDGDDYIDLSVLQGRDKTAPIEVSASTIKGKGGKVTNMSVRTVKISDKTAALQLLGKHLGMFKEQVEVTNKLSLLDMIEQSFKPALKDESNIIDSTVVEPEPEKQYYVSEQEGPNEETYEREAV